MKKILFMIHSLGQGGAEKVLVNLVNNMDSTQFDITVIALFGGGVNEQFLKSHIKYKALFSRAIPANSQIMKIFTPKQLHKILIKEQYDVEISYLEGPTARIVSGCPHETTKLVSWIHVEQHSVKKASYAFRTEQEARTCYHRFHETVCVSQSVRRDFCSIMNFQRPCTVLYNTVESDKIMLLAKEETSRISREKHSIIAVGSLKESKGYSRLLRIMCRLLQERYDVHLYILGIGPMKDEIEHFLKKENVEDFVTLLGYDTNPYKYVAKCDLFVCASFAEGFSTAATESLIVGTPVCTVDVSGMKEMLGENSEYGMIVPNDENSLYLGIKKLLDEPELLDYYRAKAAERGAFFSTEKTVKAVEDMLLNL